MDEIWVARDDDGDLLLYLEEPEFCEGEFCDNAGMEACWSIHNDWFQSVKKGEKKKLTLSPTPTTKES